LRRENHELDIRQINWENEALSAQKLYQELVERNEKRLDGLLDQQNRIVARGMGTGDRGDANETPKPIVSRTSWKNVKAGFEARDRQAYWKQRVEQVEKQKADSLNDPETEQDLKEMNK